MQEEFVLIWSDEKNKNTHVDVVLVDVVEVLKWQVFKDSIQCLVDVLFLRSSGCCCSKKQRKISQIDEDDLEHT